MAQPSSILHADRGRASATAWGILCSLVVLQSALVVHLLLTRQKPAAAAPSAQVSGITAPAPVAVPLSAPLAVPARMAPPPVGSLVSPVAAPSGGGVSPMSPPPVGTFAPPPPASTTVSPSGLPHPAPLPSPPPSALLPTTPAPSSPSGGSGLPAPGAGLKRLPLGSSSSALPSGAAGDLTVKEYVELAKQVRSLGDMQQALETLSKADLRFPNDPAVMAEMAQTYEVMGLNDKATAMWRRLEAMNPAQASGYRDMASRRLTAGTGGGLPGADTAKVLSLGACEARRDPSVVNGEKVVLRIPLLRQSGASIDPSKVDIDVFFFDRVNGEKVAQTIADDPVTTWAAPPVDWSGIGEEPLDVTYFLPQLTAGEVQAHGRRSYHGYLVKLYYQHKLQDVAAEPRDLLEYGSGPSGAGSGNPLLPPVSQ